MKLIAWASVLCCGVMFGHVQAAELRVAVASNFLNTFAVLSKEFEAQYQHTLRVSAGSTGKHYAQIIHGAPFDVFLAADAQRPQRLAKQAKALSETRMTYAVGRLVLYGNEVDLTLNPQSVLSERVDQRLSIANPRLAPYGLAAQQVLQSLGLFEQLQPRLVRGENINQAFQFVDSGNASLGLVAWSQVTQLSKSSFWLIPQSLHAPIEQQAIVLRDSVAARQLMLFLRGEKAQSIIQQHGYDTI